MNVANKVGTKDEALGALNKNGVGNDIITKVNGYLNNPMAAFIAKAAGVDLGAIKDVFGDLNGNKPQSNFQQPSNDGLAKLRAGLQQLKG